MSVVCQSSASAVRGRVFLLLLLSFGWRQQNRSLQNFTLGLISDFKLLKISNFKVTVSEAVCGWHLSQILQTWFALCFAKLCIDTGIIYLFLPSQIQTYLSLITTTHTLTVKCCFNPCLHVRGYFVAQSFFYVFWPSTHKGHLSSLKMVFVLRVPLSPFLTSDCARWYSLYASD